eukprot:COSAG05_NODE_9718_length_606_cov_1.258383_1_plen_191_part_00
MEVADELLLESELPLFVLHYEYLQIVQQFAYVTMFSVIWALAPLMNLLRNVLEGQADAHKMFMYFRRPVPSRPMSSGSTTPIGNWENMMWFQVKIQCLSRPVTSLKAMDCMSFARHAWFVHLALRLIWWRRSGVRGVHLHLGVLHILHGGDGGLGIALVQLHAHSEREIRGELGRLPHDSRGRIRALGVR